MSIVNGSSRNEGTLVGPDGLTKYDLRCLVHAAVKEKGFAGPHIKSMNQLKEVGIKYIIMNVFRPSVPKLKLENNTSNDPDIEYVSWSLQFTNVNIRAPMSVVQQKNKPISMTPNMARKCDLTYSAQLEVSCKITARAHKKDGSFIERTDTVENLDISYIPVMVGSKLCCTSRQSAYQLMNIQEDPNDSGGYFIINGTEWCVDNQENLVMNAILVYRNMYKNEIVRGEMISKPGNVYDNSFYVVIRYLNSGGIMISVTTGKKEEIEMPFFVMFRLLGMLTDREIIDNIVFGLDSKDSLTETMVSILEEAFQATYAPELYCIPIREKD
jgi:DNA-directed RNA polymerase beta subunit